MVYIGPVLVHAQTDDMLNVSNITAKIDPGVAKAFDTQDKVSVIVSLEVNETYQIKALQSEEERMKIERERRGVFNQMIDEVLATLPESEFELEGKINSTNVFGGVITKKGLDVLKLMN